MENYTITYLPDASSTPISVRGTPEEVNRLTRMLGPQYEANKSDQAGMLLAREMIDDLLNN